MCKVCGQSFGGGLSACPRDGTILSPVRPDPLIGSSFAERYEIISVIGSGGMGTVYLGKHVLMKRLVAIKVLHPYLVSKPRSLQRFQQEAQAASHLNHPNIVGIHDFGITPEGQHYLIMDYLPGTSLADEIGTHGYLTVERAVPIFLQVCEGMEHAHHKGVLHRDLKPGNILLLNDDCHKDAVQIVDFGIAKLLPESGEEGQYLTQTGEVFGSPLYMSPEQCLANELDHRSDIYTFGCVMYETLTGKPPIVGANSLHTMHMHINEAPPPMNATNPHAVVPQELESIVLKALSKDRNLRYPSMAAVGDALRQFAGRAEAAPAQLEAVPAPVASDSNSSLKAVEAAPEPESSPSAPATAVRATIWPAGFAPGGRSFLLFLIALVLVVGAASFVWQAFYGDNRRQEDILAEWERCNQLGEQSFDQGNYPEAEKWLKKALVPASRFDQPQLRLSHSLRALGDVYVALHRYTDAELALERSIAIRTEANDLECPDLVLATNQLAKVYIEQKNYSFAELQYRKLLSLEEKLFGKNSTEVARLQLSLARVYGMQGRLREADVLYKQALPIVQNVDRMTAKSVAIQVALDKYSQTQLSLEKELALKAKSHTDATPEAVKKISKLASIYFSEGQFSFAEVQYRKLVSLSEKLFGSDSVAVAQARLNLASAYAAQGELELADEQYGLALPVIRNCADPPQKEQLLVQLLSYAEVLSRTGSASAGEVQSVAETLRASQVPSLADSARTRN